jgi:hypothetical protein
VTLLGMLFSVECRKGEDSGLIFKEIWRSYRLILTWFDRGSAHGSYCSNIKQVDQT